MTVEEANKTIAEFMGYSLSECGMYWESDRYATISIGYEPEWSDSLDALVPVWEKLNYPYIEIDKRGRIIVGVNGWQKYGKTIQEAACIATARAIKELE